MNKWIPIVFFSILYCASSCVQNDLNDIDGPTYYTPSYSLPIGTTEITMENLIDEYSGTLVEVPDTVTLPDTVASFFYNNTEYFSPLVFSYDYEANFDFSSVASDMDYITSLMFRTNCVNEVPASADVQVYFLNGVYDTIDSLYKDEILAIPAASTDDDGLVVDNGELWKHDTYYDTANIEKLKETKHIVIASELDVSEISGKNVQYFPEQKIWFQLGLRVGLKIPL